MQFSGRDVLGALDGPHADHEQVTDHPGLGDGGHDAEPWVGQLGDSAPNGLSGSGAPEQHLWRLAVLSRKLQLGSGLPLMDYADRQPQPQPQTSPP